MKTKSILLFIYFSFGLLWSLEAQVKNARLTGAVIDSTATPMISATVVLLQPEDSVMAGYSLSGLDGSFVFNKVTPGDYLLQITYIGYGNYQQRITVNETEPVQNVGTLFLSPKNNLLEEVVVKAEHVPIAINQDTVEYNAAAFKTKPNAAVEDLLKKLPGVEVGRDGNIRAQGEDVQNILVDGKEFFGQDPTIATQNLPADAIDKVQVYDKKSEMAEFSGIDDGNDEKTINLELREDKKSGYFGNAEVGAGHDDPQSEPSDLRFQGRTSIHRFDSKMQASLLGMANNNNDRGFSFNDYINFMGGMANFMRGGSVGLSIGGSSIGIPIGRNDMQGITETAAGGLNFNYSFSDKVDLQSSYFINRLKNTTRRTSSSRDIGTENFFSRIDTSTRIDNNLNHRLNTTLRVKFDSSAELTWLNRFSLNSGDINSSNHLRSTDHNYLLLNNSNNNYLDDGGQTSWNSNLSFRKKISKPGRVLALNLNSALQDDDLEVQVNNNTQFFTSDSTTISESVLQDQFSNEMNWTYDANISYTEPLTNKLFLAVQAGLGNNEEDRNYDYFDINPMDPTSRRLNTTLSNRFRSNWQYQEAGLSLRHSSKTRNGSIGLTYQSTELNGTDLSNENKIRSDFRYLLPNARVEFDLGFGGNLEFRYNTRIQEPGIEQMQPNINNSNPLYLFEGNPDLIPEYRHTASFHYNLFDEFSFTSLFVNWRSTYTQDKIMNQTFVDSELRQVTQPVNTDFEFNSNIYLSFSTPLKLIKSKVNIESSTTFNRGQFLLNGTENLTDRWISNITASIENRNKEKVDLSVGASLGYSTMNLSESDAFDQDYFDQLLFVDFTWYLPRSWNIETTYDLTTFSGEDFAGSDERHLLNFKISKSFMEGERATLSLSVFDALDNNKGINRENRLNYTQETRTNVLGRYVMLGFNYKLSDFTGGIHVELDD